ncbi:filament-like plant protein 7 isoform X1 [Neltuma alba]|uniref:filament-like plant protein 7 isoform X1 n=1 Tax=Neltuma alba TaxID=207710 RepID=UPI0010A4A521|nr:filament-like plant protein 7 isoform X1 [Prosopis alba]XP_028764032.1 filament-like plant protein 7 isoform X1 [Prosopis alba]
MDHKAWLWRKKSSEKTTSASDKANLTVKENEEFKELLADKEELEIELKILNDKLASALSDCKGKDELVKKQTKIAQEAVAGWEKAESETLSLKQDREEALQQKLFYEERMTHLDGALKECMQQLRFVREEQEKRIHDAVTKASKEFEKARMVFEEQLSEATKKLAKAGAENAHLSKAVLDDQILIEGLKRQLTQAEADYSALMARLESTEKDNISLRYEVRVLEKEVEIRNEEREFNRRSADASHKQHLESAKKIAKLESECQRLRVLVRKRLPGPAALVKMKNEVEMLGRDSAEMRRKRSNSISFIDDSSVDNSSETTMKRINILNEQLCSMEEENKTLRETLNRKTNELQFSRTMLARTAFKLSQVESQLEEPSKGQVTGEQPTSLASHEFSVASISDIGSDDKASCAESWASALISELEQFKSGKQKEFKSSKSIGSSDINLMDDFAEMEKLAVVSVEKAPEISHASSEAANGINGSLDTGLIEITSPVVSKEIVPVSESSNSNDISNGQIPHWLQGVLKVISEQSHITHRNPDDILEDIKVGISHLNYADLDEPDSSKGSGHIVASNSPHFSHCIPSDDSLLLNPSSGVTDAVMSPIKRRKQQTDMSKSIGKIIEIIEGINKPAEEYDNSDPICSRDGNVVSYKNLGMPAGYMVRVFQWKTSELNNVLRRFLQACYDLLNGKADHEKFARELTTALDWIINHCFSIQDVSSMKDAIKKQFDWEETQSEIEAEIGMMSHVAEADRLLLPQEQLPCFPAVSNVNGHELETKQLQYDKDETEDTKDKVICAEIRKETAEDRLQPAANRTISSRSQLPESDKITSSELQTIKNSNGELPGQTQNHELINASIDAHLTENEIKEARHKVLALEMELENKNHCCEELEGRCLELQLLLESMKKEPSNHNVNQKEKPLRTDWEITAASEKLAECQETILNLGKQLKALSDPKDASLFDKVIAPRGNAITNTTSSTVDVGSSPAPPKDASVKQRASLLDQMLAEDHTKVNVNKYPKAGDSNNISTAVVEPLEKILVLDGTKDQDDTAGQKSLAIVPAKKRGGGSLWKKLLCRRKIGANKKISGPLAT